MFLLFENIMYFDFSGEKDKPDFSIICLDYLNSVRVCFIYIYLSYKAFGYKSDVKGHFRCVSV